MTYCNLPVGCQCDCHKGKCGDCTDPPLAELVSILRSHATLADAEGDLTEFLQKYFDEPRNEAAMMKADMEMRAKAEWEEHNLNQFLFHLSNESH